MKKLKEKNLFKGKWTGHLYIITKVGLYNFNFFSFNTNSFHSMKNEAYLEFLVAHEYFPYKEIKLNDKT